MKPRTPRTWSVVEKISGFWNISFTKGAIESAITIFLNKPEIIKKIAKFNLLTVKNVLFANWGKKSLALIIGPATSCGK